MSCTPTCCQHAKPLMVEQNRNKFSTVEEPLINFNSEMSSNGASSMDEDEDEYERQMNPLSYDRSLKRSIKSIPSVTNIHLYSEENADVPLDELKANPIIFESEDEESEDETTEVEEEISQDTATADLHFPHQLSIIYEENDDSVNNERRLSVVSRCSTLSDCSTTLMEEDNISVDYSADEIDEEENSVTVRLPLKFSFTRSKNNLVNTTLTVGESESEYVENNSSMSKSVSRSRSPEIVKSKRSKSPEIVKSHKSKSPEVIKAKTPPANISNGHVTRESPAPDVSVTFRLKSKSRTPERIIAPTLSVFNNSFDSDPECSVSISLPRKSQSKEIAKVKENVDEKSDSSGDNKKHIDSSLYTSIDAFEEIKRGMAEITNSLCSKLCTLRKSALNIPTNDPYRSSSTSQIESIDTDSENDMSLSFDGYESKNQSRKSSLGGNVEDEIVENGLVNAEENLNESRIENSDDTKNEDDTVDFWSQLSSANKCYEDPNTPSLSKTSTRSSRYWFEDEDEHVPEIQSDKEPEVKVDENISIEIRKESEEHVEQVDFWQNYDDNHQPKFRANDYFTAQESFKKQNIEKLATSDSLETQDGVEEFENEEIHSNLHINEIVQDEPMKSNDTQDAPNEYKESESEDEWTEEEVEETDYDEDPPIQVQPKNIIAAPQPFLPVQQNVREVETEVGESEYEYETEYEEEIEDEKASEEIEDEKSPAVATQRVEETDNELDCSEESEDDDESIPDAKSSSSKITKGKSLVNVNSYVAFESNSKDKIPTFVENIYEAEDSGKSEYSSAEESENESALPAESSNRSLKHSNDDCQLLTPTQTSHDEKVLHPSLTAIQSIDSKSNLTSESGISFEHNDPDSEDGYEEDSDEDAPPEDDKTVTKERSRQSQEFDDDEEAEEENEIKVNVRGKISMFERAMSEEPTEKSVKDIPRVPAKYSFKHRESSEPPLQKPVVFTNYAVPQRAVSEVKEVAKNQKLLDLINQRKSLPPTQEIEDDKRSVKEKISSFEASESDASERRESFKLYGNSKKSMPFVRSIDSAEEDSGVTSDFCKQFSENETDSENFPELRKMSRYQRASTHSRLFKLLQGDDDVEEEGEVIEFKEPAKAESGPIPYKSKKIIHNVSVTRRQNPKAALEAETMEERRRRLCLPLSHQSSSGAESMSSSTTPSPTPGAINEKLVNELVQSLLSQKKGRIFKNLPIEKLHAAAVKILQEDIESNGTLSSADESTIPTVDSTPALTPQEFRNNSSYAEYYDSWDNRNHDQLPEDDFSDLNLIQSKAFKNLQEQQVNASKKLWSVRCPRILSSKSINKDLARLSEVRESESPEPNHSRSPSNRSYSTEPMSGDKLSSQERQKAQNCNT